MAETFVPWPADLADRYRREGYWRGETLGDLLRTAAERHSGRTALVDARRSWTYSELDEEADRTAAGLRRLGVVAGDRVVVQLPNVGEFVVLCLALYRAGVIPVLALPGHRRSEIIHLCRLSEAVAYVVASTHEGFDFRDLAREVVAESPQLRHVLVLGDPAEFTALASVAAEPERLPAPDPAGVAMLLLSGGTTGLPKLIPRTHDDYAYNIRKSAELCAFDESTSYLVVLPVSHNFAWGCPGVLGVLQAGGKVVLAHNASPPEAFPLIEQEQVTTVALVPTLAVLWSEARSWLDTDLGSLRLMQVGGAKLAETQARQVLAAFGCALQQVFGMAEGLLNFTRLDDPQDMVVTTQGRPMSPADEVRVEDEHGNPVAPGECGELLTRGPYTLRGYYRAESHNRVAFTLEGYYRTGDVVRVTPEGNLVVEGRIKDQINRGGEKIAAAEVEQHLVEHPAIQEAVVVGMADAGLGETMCAFLRVSGAGPSLGEVRRFLTARGIAAFKAPDRVEVVDSWPLTSVGKVDKKALARFLAERRPAGASG
ncbi:2,3-dihydroxybenzoate-AMP ligase [Streptomyces sp. LBL]|uniref:(2,3-dihydroxybenzoyl)adenylate synthase n=1 Tax=Streptomyces sp. LBL TaxID=2940562 RepID=UPI00247340B2|nr:AMP-binding protein [Streptomyces sp. LBL]MDH6626590.1 2,3-dihydroxybenzoate-AMP ligase [Streptomyces sp. LBL]